ncbi:heme-binding protein 2-like [Pyxicephalus adspersus]|uniref:heme-binding protein 2-like n=1 Tax=Pyxicephalus adspersus TaxID=30357 RepID=UPI003B5B64CE
MEMKYLLLISLLLGLGTSETTEKQPELPNGYQKPEFCQKADCPKYEVVKQYDNFELRAYEAIRWVRTPLESDFFGLEMVKSFRRLFKYITGSNVEGMILDYFCSFPVMQIVTILSAFRSFGGYALDPTFFKEAQFLAEQLRARGLEFEDSFYLRSGYNDPFTLLNRHNEVWFIAK